LEGFPSEEAARKDSAVHVSLSSYSLVKQPGTKDVPLLYREEPSKPKHPMVIGCLFTCLSEELQRRAFPPSGGAP
jgi:hypothetical protein